MKLLPTDKNDREIMVGDTLKLFHFIGARRKKHYMYKYVFAIYDGRLRLKHLNVKDEVYTLAMDGKKLNDYEIVQGFGMDGVEFMDRPKKIISEG